MISKKNELHIQHFVGVMLLILKRITFEKRPKIFKNVIVTGVYCSYNGYFLNINFINDHLDNDGHEA